ncbi:hypothetical protein WJ39_16245 [Burkholderia diffusa]|nr:hypothetical protein WJ39_16245 [Burkholderia diffusa]
MEKRRVNHAHRTKLPIKLSRRHERSLYGTAGMLTASGGVWLIAHYFFASRGEFGDMPTPIEPWMLRIHGAAMMGFLIVSGTLLPGHVRRAWEMRRNLGSGLTLATGVVWLILTGYGLYYAGGDEQVRSWISISHWAIGLAAACLLPLHVVLGKSRKTSTPARSSPRQSIKDRSSIQADQQ